MSKTVIKTRTVSYHWTCGVCYKTFPPQMAVAVFEEFIDPLTGGENDLRRVLERIKHFQCLEHGMPPIEQIP
jgi:hypothetical protein